MRIRRVAILIDGSFFLKRLKSWPGVNINDPDAVRRAIVSLCRNHIDKLIGKPSPQYGQVWLDQVYRLFFYDAEPYEGSPFNPLLRKQIDFSKTQEARFRLDLFDLLRKERKFALRLGSLKAQGAWTPYDKYMKGLLKIWHDIPLIEDAVLNGKVLSDEEKEAIRSNLEQWSQLTSEDVFFPLRQKGVDMKIGLDIASMTLKGQVDTIILVTGDSDFVPAAKVARREGVEFILDPMWQSVDSDLMEHIDGIASGFAKPYVTKEV